MVTNLRYLNPVKETLSSLPELLLNTFSKASSSHLKETQSFIGLTLILFGTCVYYWQKYSFWSKRNVKTPPPLPFFGNFLSFMCNPRQHLELEWPKKYGKIYGIYMGTKPYLVCADAYVLKRICIKDFDKFPNHHFIGVKNKYQKHFLIIQRDDHWRGMRAVMTPTFTPGKIKIMYKILDSCADDLVRDIGGLIEESSPSGSEATNAAIVDLRDVFGAFSMGSAVSSFYGLNFSENHSNANGGITTTSSSSSDTKEGFARMSREAFRVRIFRYLITQLVPNKILEILNFPLAPEKSWDFFAERSRKIIESRQKSTRPYKDYLQLILEAKMPSQNEAADLAESNQHEEHHALLADDSRNKGLEKGSRAPNVTVSARWRFSRNRLTEEEVNCQTMMLMMVATETTATLLTNVVYLLAHNHRVQARLREELDKIKYEEKFVKSESHGFQELGTRICFDYEKLASCVYLDCVISEALRLMSPALTMDREASEDYLIEDYNVMIPRGTVVQLAYQAIHRDPDYWPEPDMFDPERFLPENRSKIVPGSYCPFGIGPRSCIGFRFALTEARQS